MKTALFVVVAGVLLVLAPAAQAAPPVLQSVSFDNATKTLTVNWSLPPGVESRVLEANTNPAVDSEGYFLFGANDGYYGANIIFELPDSASTQWVHSYPDLPPGLYYIHVGGFDPNCVDCPIREWSGLGTFTVAAKNKPPRLLSVRWHQIGHRPGVNYYVTEALSFRVCDDAPGPLRAQVTQTKKVGSHVLARAASSHRLSLMQAGCRSYKIGWRLQQKFFGVGRYTIRLRVRDRAGAWSMTVTRSTFTSD
jgi:hypothetical protein